MLEKAGAKIHGVISVRARPNRTFWSLMGVGGQRNKLKNYFEHPSDENRRVFVFSDTPHLFKTIRNRLYNNKALQVPLYEVALSTRQGRGQKGVLMPPPPNGSGFQCICYFVGGIVITPGRCKTLI